MKKFPYQHKTVTNERCKGNLLIVKTDEDKTPIQGVKFNILDADKNVILTITTNEKGLAGAKNLPMGTYYYQEIEAPEDVVIDNGVYEFKIDTQDQVVRKDIVNEKIIVKEKQNPRKNNIFIGEAIPIIAEILFIICGKSVKISIHIPTPNHVNEYLNSKAFFLTILIIYTIPQIIIIEMII